MCFKSSNDVETLSTVRLKKISRFELIIGNGASLTTKDVLRLI